MRKLNLLVVLQTHSVKSRDTTKQRYCGADKAEIMRRCVTSLVESINYASDLLPHVDISLQVFDDHSDEASFDKLTSIASKCIVPYNITQLETRGIMPSILKCYEHGKQYGKDLVYFVQDDYLYELNAIRDMVNTWVDASTRLNKPVSIFPYNDPYHYIPVNTQIPSYVVQSSGRHWRTNVLTSSCFMTHISIIKEEWDLFYKMGTSEVTPTMEDESINQLFKTRGHFLLIPIPSLALHMQFDTEKDPFINWREWWDKYDETDAVYNFEPNEKYVLNLGYGGLNISNTNDADIFKTYKEVTGDIDAGVNPDIVCDVNDLTNIPEKAVDAVYLSHMLEHLDYFEVPKGINQMLRILKPKGFIKLRVPNLKVLTKYLESGKINDTIYESNAGPVTALDMLYGYRYSIKQKQNDFMRHKTGFTKEVFDSIAKDHNFDLQVIEDGLDLIVDIYKH